MLQQANLIDPFKITEISALSGIPAESALAVLRSDPMREDEYLYGAVALAAMSTQGLNYQRLNQNEAAEFLSKSLAIFKELSPEAISLWLKQMRQVDSNFKIERDFAILAMRFPSDYNKQMCRDFIAVLEQKLPTLKTEIAEVKDAFSDVLKPAGIRGWFIRRKS